MIHLREQYWAMPVPEDAWVWISENLKTDFLINMGYLIYPKVGKKKWLSLPGMVGVKLPGLDYHERVKAYIKLPPGNWSVSFTSKEATEEQASGVVEKADEFFWKCYHDNRSHLSPLRSLVCLMNERGCDMNKNWLILKKESNP